ncbi:MAG: helicase RepA family protein [Hyphomicrobiales bacterium]
MQNPIDPKQDGVREQKFCSRAELTNVTSMHGMGAQPIKFGFEFASDITITSGAEWLIEDILPSKGLAAIYGPPGCGKSFLALDVAMHIATGTQWFDKDTQLGGVIYVAAEAGAGMRKRIAACRLGRGFDDVNVPLALVTVPPNLGAKKDGNETAKLVSDIKLQWQDIDAPIRLIVIDTLARAMFGADENSASDMGAFVSNAGLIADQFDCLVIVVHHAGKDADRGMRGSSALHGACDAEWQVRDGGSIKSVSLVKNKEGEDGLKWSFSLSQTVVFNSLKNKPATNGVVAENGRASKPITSCFLEPVTTPQQVSGINTRKEPTGNKLSVFEAVKEAIASHGKDLSAYPDLPDGIGVKRSHVIEEARKKGIGNPKLRKSQNAQINRALSALAGGELISLNGEWVSII